MPLTESIRIIESSTRVYTATYTPFEQPVGIILMVHGLGEHIRRYDEQFFYFNQKGYAVIGADLIGHGRTEGHRGTWLSMNSNYEIIDLLFDMAKQDFPNLPVYLYGHSMGANIAARYAVLKNPDIKGLILTGPAIKTPKDPPYFLVRWLLAAPRRIKNIRISNGLNLKSLCTDENVVRKYLSDPLVHDRISLGTAASIFENAHDLLHAPWNALCPVLMMHGSDDTLTLPGGTEALKNHWTGNIEYKLWHGMLHEIHNEKEKQQVWDYLLKWLNQGEIKRK